MHRTHTLSHPELLVYRGIFSTLIQWGRGQEVRFRNTLTRCCVGPATQEQRTREREAARLASIKEAEARERREREEREAREAREKAQAEAEQQALLAQMTPGQRRIHLERMAQQEKEREVPVPSCL